MKTTKERPLKVSLVASKSAEDEISTHRINRTAAAMATQPTLSLTC